MAIYARLEDGTYAEVTGVYKTDGTEVTEIFQSDRLVYSASNELYGTVPLYYDGLGYELIDYLISGNAVQDGTPSADAPVEVQGCGARTGNLFDAEFVQGGVLTDGSTTKATTRARAKVFIRPGETYSFSCNAQTRIIYAFRNDDTPIRSVFDVPRGADAARFTTPEGTAYVWVCVMNEGGTSTILPSSVETPMLNLGSTALPYEPYGFKLPLTVNGTEYPIYLGQVESTRRVKKLVLTGEETITAYDPAYSRFSITIQNSLVVGVRLSPAFCSHYLVISDGRSITNVPNNSIYSDSGNNRWFIKTTDFTTVADFKSYLAAQYAAGTPITVWYVLAEPETGIVNEPLMKIGDYADTISFAQAGVTIPTVNGANVLNMASTVKPSEVYIKGKGIKPTGYGQLKDVNGVNILDKDGRPIHVHGQ